MKNTARSILAAALLLAACQERKPQADPPAPPPAPAKPAAAPAQGGVPTGVFDYQAEGAAASLTIGPEKDGRHAVSIDLAAKGCSGQVHGVASRDGDGLAFVSSPLAGDVHAPVCRARITFAAGKPRVEELEGCGAHHGFACAFSSYP